MIANIIYHLKNNIQLSQTWLLISVLIIWIEFYWLNLNYFKLLTIFWSVIILDALFIKLRTNTWTFPFSWVNAWFWIAFFLRTESLFIYFFAALLAIAGKNFLRINGRHFLNPSNMGVFITLILFPYYTWVNSLQWWNYLWGITIKYIIIHTIIFFFGAFITYRVYKFFKYKYFIDYSLPFIALHLILFFSLQYSPTLTSALLFFSVSFFIFTFHMISDPKTVPQLSQTRFLYAINIVLAFYVLQFHINEVYALLWSLFVNTLFLPIIWYLEKYSIKKYNISFASVFSCIIMLIMIILIYWGILKYGKPDLLFDNICHQIICK